MTLDEAIKHCEENAEKLRHTASCYTHLENDRVKAEHDDCLECAEEHEQLAEWLKDYERLLSAKEYCNECDHVEMCRWYPYEGCEFRAIGGKSKV